jgi:hypothetical protein
MAAKPNKIQLRAEGGLHSRSTLKIWLRSEERRRKTEKREKRREKREFELSGMWSRRGERWMD